jgi:hypothetical protein
LKDKFYINNIELHTLLFADDQAISVNSEDNLQRAIHRLNIISKNYNMRISIDKTKVLALRGKGPIRIKIVINERILDQVLNCNYLGYNMGLNREKDINVKLQIFQQICGTIKRTLARKVRKETLFRFYKIMAIPTLLYGSEYWTLTKRQKSRLEAAEMRFLRSVAGYRLIDHRRNEDIREELQIIDINSRIKDYQIKWLQHVERMEQNRIPKLLLNYKLGGIRDQGRPCRRWREQF